MPSDYYQGKPLENSSSPPCTSPTHAVNPALLTIYVQLYTGENLSKECAFVVDTNFLWVRRLLVTRFL